ncbi:MAG TPA: amino acid ABC transporter substrate-binding protein [Candidatus Limnocylindria bacterium]
MRKLSAIALVAAFVVAACGGGGTGGGASGSGAPTSNAAANIPDTLKIGAVLPLSGADAKTGQYINDAYVLYTKQVNDKGGLTIAGKKVKLDLRIEDNKDDGATSAQLYEKLITQDNVDFLLGGYNTALVTQEIKVANRYKIPYVNGGGASAASYVDNTWAFGLLATIQGLAHTQLDFMSAQQDAGKLPKPLKMAIVYENSSHGKEFSDGLKDGDASRFKIVLNEPFDLNGKDFTSLLQKVKDAGADAFMADAHLPDFITMQRQYAQLGMHHLYITYGARGPDQSAKDQLGAATDYITSAVWFDQQQPGDAVKAWVDMWKANTKDSPEWYAASGWETARILYAALEKAGTVDKDKVRQTLSDTTWDKSIFPGGSIKFDKTGQATNSYVMTQNLPGGKTILIWPKDQATGAAIVPVPSK